MKKNYIIAFFVLILSCLSIRAQITLESEVKITDNAMVFDGSRNQNSTNQNVDAPYDYAYGSTLTPHGDCVKTYGKFVFLTWYRGGKGDRHVMLSRYNTETKTIKTIEFPHQHTGFNGKWWIGETHNTIAVGICPKDETIHLVYDMHRNGNVPDFANDYLRYSYSQTGAATVADDDFTIAQFVQSPNNNYKHLSFHGITDVNTTKLLTYPAFFTNDEGDLFMKNRFGYAMNGKFLFAKYDGDRWEGYTDFNRTGATNYGSPYNWGLYGDIKYVAGKIRIGFQQRASIRNDKYLYQNGFYYAYSDDPSGLTQWKDYQGNGFNRPLAISEKIKISEPGDLVATTEKDKVYIVSGFDWTVTDREDIHFIGRVKDRSTTSATAGQTKQVHTYKPAGASDFITTTNFSGAEAIYAAGDKVYLIGLNGAGRPFIESAPGGTNVFTRVYEATSGKRFKKGQVYINNGKLYYYLLENHPTDKDDTQPTFLQIIDLGIDEGPSPFEVNLLTPADNASYEQGDDIQLYAQATTDVGELTKVEFLINGQKFIDDTQSPYLQEWVPTEIGTYTLKAIAYNTSGNTVTSSEITVTVTEVDKTDLSGEVYRLKNVATGQFITDAGASATPVTMGAPGDEPNKNWSFVKSGDYFNIDSETFGILRATGANFSGGANAVVSTGKSSPAADSDKVWTVHYIEAEDVYRFEAKNTDRFLYHEASGKVTAIPAPVDDDRSKWQVISKSTALSLKKNQRPSPVYVYPNPAHGSFTIRVQEGTKIHKVEMFSILGKKVYDRLMTTATVKINNDFVPGMYLVKVHLDRNRVHHTKLILR